jgi:hypothetical protein
VSRFYCQPPPHWGDTRILPQVIGGFDMTVGRNFFGRQP